MVTQSGGDRTLGAPCLDFTGVLGLCRSAIGTYGDLQVGVFVIERNDIEIGIAVENGVFVTYFVGVHLLRVYRVRCETVALADIGLAELRCGVHRKRTEAT